ncbi:hypothetical protein [Nocardioides sp. YIM 152588]|uniref:hypothetical protein n=1 Tax=Nocardioides sp. YIM 152588 TaxID=3158259 RepID=UPI0032E3BD46
MGELAGTVADLPPEGGPEGPEDWPARSLERSVHDAGSMGAPPALWAPRLSCSPPPGWGAARLLRLVPDPRTVRYDGRESILEEDGVCELVACLVDVRSLPSAGFLHPPLSRLRMLHQRLLGADPGRPGHALWDTLLGEPAVLDLFAHPGTGAPSGFSLACAGSTGVDGEPLLAVLAGTAPAYRARVLDQLHVLASRLVQPPGPIAEVPPTWVAPDGWDAVEEVQLSTETYLATVRLSEMWEGATVEDVEEVAFSRAPFLRDLRDHGRRRVAVGGVREATLRRFDWQPAGRARTLTTACFGLADGPAGGPPVGFTVVAEVPLGSEDARRQLDEVLERVQVLRP